MSDDFKDMEYYTEESLKEFWRNEPEGVWEQYIPLEDADVSDEYTDIDANPDEQADTDETD